MKLVTTRELQPYYPPVECRSRISLLDKLCGVAYSKLTWFNNENGIPRGSTLRYIDIAKAIDALTAYLILHQHNNHYKIKKSLSVKRELLDVLLILKDK